MKCRIDVEMDNAAFEMDPGTELANVLRGLAAKVEDNDRDMLLFESTGSGIHEFDANGNACAWLKVTP